MRGTGNLSASKAMPGLSRGQIALFESLTAFSALVDNQPLNCYPRRSTPAAVLKPLKETWPHEDCFLCKTTTEMTVPQLRAA